MSIKKAFGISIDATIMMDFQAKCKKEGVTASWRIQKMLISYLANDKVFFSAVEDKVDEMKVNLIETVEELTKIIEGLE